MLTCFIHLNFMIHKTLTIEFSNWITFYAKICIIIIDLFQQTISEQLFI